MFRGDKKQNSGEVVAELTPIIDKILDKISGLSSRIEDLQHVINAQEVPHTDAEEAKPPSEFFDEPQSKSNREPEKALITRPSSEDTSQEGVTEAQQKGPESTLHNELQSLKRESADLQAELVECESEKTHLVEERKQITNKYINAADRFKKAEEERQSMGTQLDAAASGRAELESQKTASESAKVEAEKQCGKMHVELDGAITRLTELENLRTASENAKQVIEGKLHEIQTQLDAANSQITELTELKLASETGRQQAESQRDEQQQLLGVETQRNEDLSSELAELKHQLAVDERLEALMWPGFLSAGEMHSWRLRLEESIMESPPAKNAVLLIASLFTYNAAVNQGKDWNRRLIDVLYDFSQAFFSWCRDLGYDNEQATDEAKKWAASYNTTCSGILKIIVPEPDTPFDRRTMVTYEDGGAATARDVKAVKSWCIKDDSGRIMKQAEVTTC